MLKNEMRVDLNELAVVICIAIACSGRTWLDEASDRAGVAAHLVDSLATSIIEKEPVLTSAKSPPLGIF